MVEREFKNTTTMCDMIPSYQSMFLNLFLAATLCECRPLKYETRSASCISVGNVAQRLLAGNEKIPIIVITVYLVTKRVNNL